MGAKGRVDGGRLSRCFSLNLERHTSVRVVRRLAVGDAVGWGVSERIEHLPTRRSFGVFVNLLVGSLGLVDFYTKPWQLPVGSLVTRLGESVSMFWERLPVPLQLLLLTLPTEVARRSCSAPFPSIAGVSRHRPALNAGHQLTPISFFRRTPRQSFFGR